MEDRQIEELLWRFSESGDGRDLFNYLVQRTLDECGAEIDFFLGRNVQNRLPTASSSGNRVSNTDVRMLQRRMRAVADQVANTEKFRGFKQKILRDTQLTAQRILDRPESSSLGFSTISEEDDNTIALNRSEGLGQSTKFPMESEVLKALNDLTNLQLTDSTRLRSIRKILSMSTFSIGKSSGIETFFEKFSALIANPLLTEDMLAFTTKLFNSEEIELVQKTFCSLMGAAESIPIEFKLKFCHLAHQMFNVCPTIWKRYPSENSSAMIESVMKLMGKPTNLGQLSVDNVLVVLSAMDPHANWIRTWMHSTAYRRYMRVGMEQVLRRILKFLSRATEETADDAMHFHDFYSTSELTTMITISYSTIVLISLQYPDLYAPYPDLLPLVLKVLGRMIKRNFKTDRCSYICKALGTVLTDVSAVQKSAEVLRTIFPVIINIRSSLEPSSVQDLAPMINRYLNFKQPVIICDVFKILKLAVDKSRPELFAPLLSKELLVKHKDLFIASNPVLHSHMAKLIQLPLPELERPGLWRFQAPLSPLTMSDHRKFAKILCTWILDPSCQPIPPNVMVLTCQPSLLVECLNSSDFATFFDAQFHEIQLNRRASFLPKLAFLAANADFAMEVRRSHDFLLRVSQICSTKCLPCYDDVTEACIEMLKSLILGSSEEIKTVDWNEMPKKLTDVIPLMYIQKKETVSPKFEADEFLSDPFGYLLGLWRNGAIPHQSVLKSLAGIVRESSNAEESKELFRSCGQDWTPLLDYVEYCLGMISENRKAVRRLGQSILVPYASESPGTTDWLLAILFILSRFDRSTSNELSKLLSLNPNVTTVWPAFHKPSVYAANVHSRVLPIVENVLSSNEFFVIQNAILAAAVPLAHLLTFYLNQAYLNILDWNGISDYVVLSLLGGSEFQAHHFCSVLYCLKDDLLKMVNSSDVSAYLLRPQIDSSEIARNYHFVVEIVEERPITESPRSLK
ncbi:hypothetical protein L596_007022 [Steinernema carpocapsae]|uniref:BROMI C-terminal Rab TBC-like domain-containing protein n=1 Tax=Steinernema carpocapsae TaxID=34508 RepID=A0A4U5P7Z2_STECR|nr:hypothetical protein L596_007022 [Steinernema carpocapsae]